MTYRTRTVLFIIAIVLFAVLGYGAVMYAQGYKYSFTEQRFFRTGAITLSANHDGDVYINDELDDSTSFIGSSFGSEGLLPNRYSVRLQAEGYSSWQKVATVQEGEVTDFPAVLILPTDSAVLAKVASESLVALHAPAVIVGAEQTPVPSPRRSTTVSPTPAPAGSVTLAKGVLTLATSDPSAPDVIADEVLGYTQAGSNDRIAYWTRNELWVLWLRDTSYQPFKKAGDRELITRFATPIARVAWYPDRDHLVVDAGGLRIVEVDTRGGVNIIKL